MEGTSALMMRSQDAAVHGHQCRGFHPSWHGSHAAPLRARRGLELWLPLGPAVDAASCGAILIGLDSKRRTMQKPMLAPVEPYGGMLIALHHVTGSISADPVNCSQQQWC